MKDEELRETVWEILCHMTGAGGKLQPDMVEARKKLARALGKPDPLDKVPNGN